MGREGNCPNCGSPIVRIGIDEIDFGCGRKHQGNIVFSTALCETRAKLQETTNRAEKLEQRCNQLVAAVLLAIEHLRRPLLERVYYDNELANELDEALASQAKDGSEY